MKLPARLLSPFLAALMFASNAQACSRVTWLGPENQVVTGRSMDWFYAFNAHFYIFPRGTEFNGAGGQNSLNWVSKYGTVSTAGTANPDGPINGVFDGINEKGLVANLLYLGETDFGAVPTNNKPRLYFAAWTQYVLSNYATVNEVVDAFKDNPIYIVPIMFGPGKKVPPTVHLSVSDSSGDSAIFEFIKGKLIIHHNRKYQVMTNSPAYEEQLALNVYWKKQDGSKNLPGSHLSEDRFVRASYYLSKLPQTTDERKAVAGVFSVMRDVSVPWGQPDPEHPNLAPTYWRTVADQKNLLYFFESTLSPNIVWVNLHKLNFNPGSGVRSLKVEDNYSLIGNVDNNFQSAKPINFLAP
ncbi:MAG: linear amide C-N hydrolase [Cyanobacteriota bacterium ELA615]